MRHPCMTFWPEKFFGDTAHLSWEERGAYLLLLSLAWVRGGGLPNDDQQLRRMVGCGSKKWRAMRPAVMAFWKLQEDGLWHQKRLDVEWNRANERTQRRASGRTSGDNEAKDKTQGRASGRTTQLSRGTRSMAKKSMISTRARADNPTPTPTEKNSALQAESSSLATATLSVRAHASPSLRVITNTEAPIPPDEQARVAEGLARLKLELEQSAAALDAQDIHNRRS